MDANNNKTLAVAFVALLVGATFVAATSAVAQTTVPNPTSAADAGVDASTRGTLYLDNTSVTITTGNGTIAVSDISFVTLPSAQRLRWNTSYDLTFVNIFSGAGPGYGYLGSGSPTTEVTLYTPSGHAAGTATVYPVGCGTTATPCSATFANFLMNQTGTWTLQSSVGASIANIFVFPSDAMTVSLNPNSMAYTSSASLFTLTATNGSTGQGVNGGIVTSDAPGYLGSSSVTNPSGVFQFFQAPPGAGTFNFYVSQNYGGVQVGGLDFPELRGATLLTVTPLGLTMQAGNGTAFTGFSTPISFRPLLANGTNAFDASTVPQGYNGYNISVTTPDNFLFFANTTTSSIPTTLTLTCRNLTIANGTCFGSGVPTPTTFQVANGEIRFAPATTWASGTYTFAVGLNTAGSITSSALEYTGTYTVSPGTPAAVNLAFTAANSTDLPNTLNVLPAVIVSSVNDHPGRYTLYLFINGSTQTEHPACRDGPTCSNPGDDVSATAFRNNITLRGDVMTGYSVTGYTASTGMATIEGVTPTQNGTIFIDVAWKNTTTTLTVPVYKGAKITLSASNLTVDTVSTLTVTVTDAFGNPQPGATVQIMRRHGGTVDVTGTTTIVGTGANASVGQGGQYAFNIRPNSIQDYVVYASIQNGANFSYAPFSVIPAQDLVVTLDRSTANAGQNTNFLVNVTNATGIGQTSGTASASSGNFRVFFLNATQRANLLNNGTTTTITAGGLRFVNYTNNSATGANVSLSLDAGTYYVWVCQSPNAITDCASATHDNRNNMPTVTVSAYNATFNPSQVASTTTIQGATTVNVRITAADGGVANGTLTMLDNSSLVTGGSSVTITNGQGNITLTGANAGIGDITWVFNPDEPATGVNSSSATSRVVGVLSVSAGNLTFQPTRVPILQSTLVTVRLTNFTGGGLAGREIRICGVSLNSAFPSTFPASLTATDIDTNTAGTQQAKPYCPALGVTESDGSTGIVVTPTALSNLGVYINDSYTGRTIPITAGTLTMVLSPTAPQAGGNVTFTVTQPGGTPSVGARIQVTRDGTSVLDTSADGNGQATLTGLTAGNYTALASRTGFENATASFTIGQVQTNTTNAVFELSNLTTPSTITTGTPFSIGVRVTNTGNASGTANALLFVNGQQRGSESVTLAAGESRNLTYSNLALTAAGSYTIVVRIGNVEIGPNTITVGGANVTTPVTTTVGTTTPGTTTTPVVTSPGTTTTPVVTSPAVTPTTTPETPTEDEPDVPGFEVVALLAALGVALLVLRRRQK